MSVKNSQIDEYLQTLPEQRCQALTQLRALILDTVPDVEETIAYKMPAATLPGQEHVLCSYKSQKNYISLYMDVDVVAAHEDDLADLNCGKSCIRFTRFEQLPQDAIRQMLRETATKQRDNR